MPKRQYVFSEEKRHIQEETVKRAMNGLGGPVGFYEKGPGIESRLILTDEVQEVWRPFCQLVWQDEDCKKRCHEDHENRAEACRDQEITTCWLGIHNIACHVKDDNNHEVTLMGGVFHIREESEQMSAKLHQFLEKLPIEEQEKYQIAWNQLPEFNNYEAKSKLRELEITARSYLYTLEQRSNFRYAVDLMMHDLIIVLQELLGETELLKIGLKESFNIGKKWEKRFDSLMELYLQYNEYFDNYLETMDVLGKKEYEYESISKMIHECIDLNKQQANSRDIDLRVDLGQRFDEAGNHKVIKVLANRISLQQAIRNIIDNAIKYSFSGTSERRRYVEVKGRVQPRKKLGYLVQVSNYGIGIEPDEIKKVFLRRYQGRRRAGEDRSGHGLGLTFVKECIEQHHGSVSIRSFPMEGTGWLTILEVWLPIY
jgi:two-component system phosphate regulon sensor histidine kinase PhoR